MTQSPTDRNRHIKAALAALGASLGVAMVPLAEAGDGSVKPADAVKEKAATPTSSKASKANQKTAAVDLDLKRSRVPPVKKDAVDAAKKTP